MPDDNNKKIENEERTEQQDPNQQKGSGHEARKKIKQTGGEVLHEIGSGNMVSGGMMDSIGQIVQGEVITDIIETFNVNLPLKGSKVEVVDSPQVKNESYHIQVRKHRSALITSGIAVIAFGIWSLFKTVMELSSEFNYVMADMDFSDLDQETVKMLMDDNLLFKITLVFVLVALGIDLVLRAYVGLSARSVGLGTKKKRNVWLFFACVLLLTEVLSLIVILGSLRESIVSEGYVGFFIMILAQVTSTFVSAKLTITGFRYTKLLKKLKKEKLERQALQTITG